MKPLPQAMHAMFSESGPLSRIPHFEYRPQQQSMAIAIAAALEGGEHLVIEAPTGIGKTLAYLLPAVLHALQTHHKAVVSTHTKNLQEQMVGKDIPIARSILGVDFPAVALKGRRNYLCRSRLQTALSSIDTLFGNDAQEELRRIADWSLLTSDGDIEHLGFSPRPEVWDMVCSMQDACNSTLCGSSCFYQRSREQARRASVVIMNHALFFTLLALQGTDERFIFDNDFVIFDEAHTLETVAGQGIGKSISWRQALLAIHRLYNPRTKKGLLVHQKKGLKSLCGSVEREVTQFFEELRLHADVIPPTGVGARTPDTRQVRIRVPHLVGNTVAGPLQELQQKIRICEEESDSVPLSLEFAGIRRALWEVQVLIDEFLEQSDPACTYWVDMSAGRRGNVTLYASPSDIGDMLGSSLFAKESPVILTSATLSVQGSLDYYQRRIGATGISSVILDSPFDHWRQARICVARDIPEPDTEGYRNELPGWILRCIQRTDGRALVLFTSAAVLEAVSAYLSESLKKCGIQTLIQGKDQQRDYLLREFRQDTRSVLLGLDSFWYGVDVPGESLTHVIITRLPFAVPSHPLIEARMEAIASRGGNTFLEYTLPEAILKFRQGAGRLLRSSTDHGIISILDSRILHKSYGRAFILSLPRCPLELLHASGEVEELFLDA